MDLSAIVLPDRDPPAVFLDDVRAAEAAGVRTVWTYDHLSWRDLRDGPWHATVPLLAAAAVTTSTVRLGTLVANPNVRHPVTFAKDAMTLDALSGGRLDLGVGAGGEGADATVMGGRAWSARERADRFEEWLGLLDSLLRQPATTYDGVHYSATDARMLPGSVGRPRVPLTVAAAGPRALRLAARHAQAWVTYGPVGPDSDGADPEQWFAAIESQGARLAEALAVESRDPTEVRRLVQIGLDTTWPVADAAAYDAFLARAAALGTDEVVVHWPRADDGRGLSPAALGIVLAAHGLAAG